MFKIISATGSIETAYGTYVDEYGTVQFVLCNSEGEFYVTDTIKGYWTLYKKDV